MFMDHAAKLERHADAETLWQEALSVFAAAGLSHVIYLVTNPDRSQIMLRSNMPEIYRHMDPAQDPFLDYCCKSYDTTWTGMAYLPDYGYLPETAQSLIRSAREAGFVSGVGIPTRLEGSERLGGFNLGSGLDRDAFEARFAAHVAEIQALCFLLHRRFEELATPLDPALSALTPREAEIIQMLAQGMTRKECARSLGLSPNTVADYSKAAYRKLGVRNRVEAARLFQT